MVSQEVRNVIVQAHVLQVSTCLDNGPWTVMNHDVLEQVGGFNRKSYESTVFGFDVPSKIFGWYTDACGSVDRRLDTRNNWITK